MGPLCGNPDDRSLMLTLARGLWALGIREFELERGTQLIALFCWLGTNASDRDLASVTPECIMETAPPHHRSSWFILYTHVRIPSRRHRAWFRFCNIIIVVIWDKVLYGMRKSLSFFSRFFWCIHSLMSLCHSIRREMGSDHWGSSMHGGWSAQGRQWSAFGEIAW